MNVTVTGGAVGVETRYESEGRCGLAAPLIHGREGVDEECELEGVDSPQPPTSNERGEAEGVEGSCETDASGGTYRLVAPYTPNLVRLSRWWMKFRKLRVGMSQAGLSDDEVHSIRLLENRYNRRAKKALERHPLGPWLADLPGLGGASTAFLVGKIRDPWRFPGQRCEEGHYVRPEFEKGEPCPIDCTLESEGSAERCGAPLLAPRRGTGVRALWHYCGLYPGATKQKGQQSSWDPELKGLCLAPDTGLAAQIVRLGPEPYRTIYDDEKERLIRERGYRSDGERVDPVEADVESEGAAGKLPPLIRLDRIARTIAVKAFVGDLLMEWKERQPLGSY